MEADLWSTIADKNQKYIVAFLVLIVVASGLALSLYMYNIDKYALTYYGDAVSHLVSARKLFDWAENPGLNQLGTVWLPLPHFLLMFPSYIDGLFFSGFAGLVVSLSSLAGTAILLYKTIARLLAAQFQNLNNSNRSIIITYASFSAALLYTTNPNFLYLGITAMTEALFMMFFVASAYYLLRWHEQVHHQHHHQPQPQQYEQRHNTAITATNRQSLKYLVISSIFITAASLCRYEAWILPLFLIIFAPVFIVVRTKRLPATIHKETMAREFRYRNTKRYVVYTILVSLISFSGIVLWLVYNAINYGDPLEFENAELYSAASQAFNRSFRENLFLQPYNVANVYGLTALAAYGPIIIVAAATGYYLQWRKKRDCNRNQWSIRYLFIFLALPPIFTLCSMLIGIGEMTFWFNSRFVILLAPLLMLLVGFYIALQPQMILENRKRLIGLIAALFIFQLVTPFFAAVVTLDDAKSNFRFKQTPYAVSLGEKLSSLYGGTGSIMIITGSAQEHRILLASGIALKNFDSIIESSTWKKSFYEPWKYSDNWIVIGKEPDSDGMSVVKYWTDNRSILDLYYRQIFENKYYEVLELK